MLGLRVFLLFLFCFCYFCFPFVFTSVGFNGNLLVLHLIRIKFLKTEYFSFCLFTKLGGKVSESNNGPKQNQTLKNHVKFFTNMNQNNTKHCVRVWVFQNSRSEIWWRILKPSKVKTLFSVILVDPNIRY